MVSAHDFTPWKKAPLLTSPVSLGRIFVGSTSTFPSFPPFILNFPFLSSFLLILIYKTHLLLLINPHVFKIFFPPFLYCFCFYLFFLLLPSFIFIASLVIQINLKFWKIWEEIWSDLALWDVDFGGSCLYTKLLLSSHLVEQGKPDRNSEQAIILILLLLPHIFSLSLDLGLVQWAWQQSPGFMYWQLTTALLIEN